MTYEHAEALAGIQGTAGKNGNDFVNQNDNILPFPRQKSNFIKSENTAPSVAFALSLAAPLDEPPVMANDKRFRFLYRMREQLPAWLWSEARAGAGIYKNGLTQLSPTESKAFVNMFGGEL